ncbi:MAG TPA: NAD-dependent epimerase/dehydratase family protein [Acidimicrobiales bacterium]|nr:NAD-dependent epimerase/dehydratase family protein [Acidimicrobiales bacterium]
MLVLVTGATGFVGSHAVAALTNNGHDVRILVREPRRIAAALEPHGVSATAVQGDMTDPVAVAAAVKGCDAVIHAAGEVGVEGGTGPKTTANVDGVRTVVSAALEAGADPVLYTSTITVHLPTNESVITPDSPLAQPLSAYGTSKRDAELLVRQWQAEGAPVTSFTIGGVYGPTSPHLDGSFGAVLAALETLMLVPPGGLGVVDVRDLATMLSSALEPGRGPRRYLAGGQYVTWAQWTRVLGEAAGVEVAHQEITAAEMIDLGRHFDRQRAAGKGSTPLSEEAAIIMTSGVPTDDSATLDDLGCSYRPLVETFTDTIGYLRLIGRLTTDRP